MGNKGNWMVAYVGAGYIAIGIIFAFSYRNISQTNIDLSMIPNMIFAITISSALFAGSDLLDQSFIEGKRINNIRLIEIKKDTTELELYNKINEAENKKLDPKYEIIININNVLFYSAFAVGVIFVFYEFPMDEIHSTGLTILTFGLIIATYGFREVRKSEKNNILKSLWFKYYEMKSKKETLNTKHYYITIEEVQSNADSNQGN